ncbi:MAG: type VI secretion system tube protein Hcp [Gammaproteobacteria bacterium]|nr:type VI secretion system tube protein Hcp [Gammaproteobacteria bacterium]
MAIFLKAPELKGDATHEKYKGSVVVDTVHFGVTKDITTRGGAAGTRNVSAPNFQEVTITKVVDGSVVGFLQQAFSSKVIAKLEINFVATSTDGKPAADPFLVYTLENVLVSSYVFTAPQSSHPMESIGLNFTRIEVNFTGRGIDNKAGAPQKIAYDIAKTS